MSSKFKKNRLHKLLRLRVASYACHEKSRNSIAVAIRDSSLKSARLHFHVYLCEVPSVGSKTELPCLIAPFIDHEVVRRTLSLDVKHHPNKRQGEAFLTKVKKALSNHKVHGFFNLPLAYTNSNKIYNRWEQFLCLGPISEGTLSNKLFIKWQKDRSSKGIIWSREKGKRKKEFYAKDCLEDIKKKLNSAKLTWEEKIAYVNIFALLYYALITTSNKNDCLYYVAAPLCTQRTFYGTLMAVVETPSIETDKTANRVKDIKKALEKIQYSLQDQANEVYLPTLILSQNSWEEHVLSDYLKKAGEAKELFKDFECNTKDHVYSRPTVGRPKSNSKYSENDFLEKSLFDLWQRRKDKVNGSMEAIKESLILGKMMAASPGLINTIRQVSRLGLSESTKGPLQSVLVVAPPGSGKEMMSKLIPILSKNFWDKPVISLNMGSIILDMQEDGKGFRGLLRTISSTTFRDGGVLVLDELNSLDIAVQPMLLRLLEEGEISPYDDGTGHNPGSKTLNWLVIGLINEEPSRLTLENLREKMTDQSLFGEILGSALYEHWKGKSRLRDDLYYRIRRCGEIRMTGLNNRRPDIPIVFYFCLRKLINERVISDNYSYRPATIRISG